MCACETDDSSETATECEAEDPGQAFERLVSTLAAPVQVRKGRKDRIVAAGTVDRPDRPVNVEGVGLDQLAGFVREVRGTPRWAGPDSTFVDTVNHLVGVLRRGHLIAVHADDRTVDRLQRWLDRAPTSSLGRIPTEVLEATLLRGEAKGTVVTRHASAPHQDMLERTRKLAAGRWQHLYHVGWRAAQDDHKCDRVRGLVRRNHRACRPERPRQFGFR